MNALNYQQKIAVMRILLDIINADGRIDVRETFYYEQLKKEMDIMEDNASEDVANKNSLLALAQIKTFDEEQKTYLATLMNNMSIVDEDVNVNEVAIYNVVCEFANIKRKFQGL